MLDVHFFINLPHFIQRKNNLALMHLTPWPLASFQGDSRSPYLIIQFFYAEHLDPNFFPAYPFKRVPPNRAFSNLRFFFSLYIQTFV